MSNEFTTSDTLTCTTRFTMGRADARALFGSFPAEPTREQRIAEAWEHFARQWELTEAEIQVLAGYMLTKAVLDRFRKEKTA